MKHKSILIENFTILYKLYKLEKRCKFRNLHNGGNRKDMIHLSAFCCSLIIAVFLFFCVHFYIN